MQRRPGRIVTGLRSSWIAGSCDLSFTSVTQHLHDSILYLCKRLLALFSLIVLAGLGVLSAATQLFMFDPLRFLLVGIGMRLLTAA